MHDDAAALPDSLRKHLLHPVGAGAPDPANDFRTGRAENAACGDLLVLHVRERDGVLSLRFQARGCSAVLAVASWLCERLEGASVAEAARLDVAAEVEALGGLPRQRRHATAVATRALRSAMAA